MERGSKRKAAAAASSPVQETRPAKRQKTPDLDAKDASSNANETLEITTATDPDEFPEYYEDITSPIAIDTIEEKLKNREYPNMNALDSDVKRMVANAKQFNESKSEIYSDAERVRKMTFNYMVKANPSYKKSAPQPQPTPVPAGSEKKGPLKLALKKSTTNGTKIKESQSSPQLEPPSAQASRSMSPAPTGVAEDKADKDMEDAPKVGYESMSFQDAQEKLIREFIDFQDPESGLAIYTPFVNLPPRTLTDYYAFIQNPTSLRSVLRKVRGVRRKGDKPSDGSTEFKSWDAFIQEIGKIWNNARSYNEDDSEIFVLAGEFEKAFEKRLAQVKKIVKEPQQSNSIKLNMSSTKPQAPLKLRLGSHKASPGPEKTSASPATGQGNKDSVTVDQQALQRQKAHVKAGMNEQQKAKGPQEATASSFKGATNLGPNDSTKSTQKSQSPAVNGDQPARASNAPAVHTSMPPPSSHSSQTTSNNQSVPFVQGPSQQFMQHYAPPSGFESKWRHKGRDILLPKLHVSTHPDLRLEKPTHLDLPAHEELAQQHITVTVPNTYSFFQFVPELPSFLKAQYPGAQPQRQHKLFVTANGVRIPPRQPQYQQYRNNMMNGAYGNGVPGPGVNDGTVNGNPVYDIKLMPGAVNRVEVEIVSTASPGRVQAVGAVGKGAGGELEMEKCFVYVHILKKQ
ncbi:MAG: hypothetical protein M1831_007583 [Alyxoria varia]|nr:MAG: hypothetical protein M1831_007583 [Alyxoria varia]